MIEKAVIPIAGQGMRLRPLSGAVPKALLPLPDGRGRIRPVLHWICAEAAAAGIQHVAVVVSPRHVEMVRRYFDAAGKTGDRDLPKNIEYAILPEPEGLGAGVLRAEDFVGRPPRQPFMLLLGDHVHLTARNSPTCAEQVARAFAARAAAAMVGMQDVAADQLPHVGAAAGRLVADRLYRCTDLLEKPDLATARRRLVTPGLPKGQFLAHCGIYVFTCEIFDCLRELHGRRGQGEELQLTDAQAILLARHPEGCFLYHVDGRTLDTGTPEAYIAAFQALAKG